MRAPAFWDVAPPTIAARALSPVASLWGAAAARRMAAAGARLPVPVICVGNFVVGGAGKTPIALAIAQLLRARGRNVFFLTRGYGGASRRAPLRVDIARDSAAEVGDEPLLLARVAPTIVSADRRAGGWAAISAGAEVIVMDDGLQNPALAKTLSLAVIDGAVGLGNTLCVPAGPLRAPLAAQWPHVSAAVIIGPGAAGEAARGAAQRAGKLALTARLRPDPSVAAGLRGQRIIAVAGIGRPQKFFDTLEEIGADIVARRAFSDHHIFTAREIETLAGEARAKQAALVTTEKDGVRLPRDFGALTLPVTAAFDDPAALNALLDQALRPEEA